MVDQLKSRIVRLSQEIETIKERSMKKSSSFDRDRNLLPKSKVKNIRGT
jgi:uncharacterized small protein (DUF1192 family)